MPSDVNPIPEDLRELCRIAQRVEAELTPIMPPIEIVEAVVHRSPDEDKLTKLRDWIQQQEHTWNQAQKIMSELPEADEKIIPDWYLEPWAFPLRSKWAAGLNEAVEAAQQWLNQRST